jgi:transcriptional regulator GlxA family with amidase domain
LVAGLCLGAYALAYSGLLDGRRATTHWKFGEDFSVRFPSISCDINPLFIKDENILTSAGSAASIDCCLHIVKQFYGAKIANKIARMMVSSPERSGGQRQYIEHPTLERPKDERIAKLLDHVVANINANYTLAYAADYCVMSIRSFSRNFKSSNGISFTAWLVNTRLNHSLELLESTDLPITHIAEQSGFHSEQVFRKHFKHHFDTSPLAWRNMFRSHMNT